MHVKYRMIICLLSAAGFSFVPPGDPVPSLRKQLEKYYRNYPCEKVYLQPDRQVYVAGETIWFSANLTYRARPSSISAVLYAELFNDKGLIINRSMLPVTAGAAAGEFLLPATLPPGIYYLRAYTAWMLNFSSSLFCYRKITIEGNGKTVKEVKAFAKPDFSVQFFPESGQLVSRLTSQVVFKAVDANGKPLDIAGKIINSMGDTVALLKTIHEGMGRFVIHCSPQAVYTAMVTANGITKKIPLPAVQSSGIVLHLECNRGSATDSIFFHISRSGEQKDKYESLILCAQQENHFSVTKIHFDSATINDPLDTLLTAPYPLLLNNFSPGVLHVSVVTASGDVLAERPVFLHDYTALTTGLQAAAVNAPGGEKKLLFTVPEQFIGKFTVAVTDADRDFDTLNSENIRSGLLIGSALSGSVQSPGWYLQGNDPFRDQVLDLLTMTGNAGGFNLRKVLAEELPPIKYLPEKSLSFSGRAWEMNGDKKMPLVNGSVFLLVKAASDSLSRVLTADTDSAGAFTLGHLYFHDTADFYIQTGVKTQGRTRNAVAIDFYNTIFDSIAHIPFVQASSVLSTNLYSKDSPVDNAVPGKEGKLLQNVTVTARGKTHLDSVLAKYASGFFANPGAWVTTLDLTNDPITQLSDQNVLDYLNGKVAGLNYAYNNGLPVIYWRFSNVIAGLSGVELMKLNAPSFFLNESLLNTGPEGYDAMVQLLSGVRMADVVMVRIFKPGTMPNVPDNGPHGTIAIYLKNGTEMDKPSSQTAFQQFTKAGFTKGHEFSQTGVAAIESRTIYWNTSLEADKVSHTVLISFYNKHNARRFRVVAEGLDEKGHIIQLNQVIQ